MEWESTPEENQMVCYGTEAIPSTSVIEHEDVMSGPCSVNPDGGGGNIFERINVRDSKNVRIGGSRNYYYGNITQIIHQSEQLALQNSPISQTGSPLLTIDDEFLQNVPYLRSLYSTENAYMASLLWDDDERDYSLKEYFIDLKLDEEDLLGKFKKRQDIPLEDIFLPDKGERSPSRILITGNPGYGKSTICSKLAYDWAVKEPPHYLSHFDIVIIIPLYQLGKRRIEEVVIDILSDEETDIEKFKKSLYKSRHQFLILLDGLDEASDSTHVENSLKPCKSPVRLPSNTTILITSRSHAAKSVRKLFHRHLCVDGFTGEKQKEYIEMFFSANHKAEISIFKMLLSEGSVINEFAQCPLMLHLMCCLHEETDLSSLKRLTDLYLQVFNLFVVRCESKYSHHPLLQEGRHMKGEYFFLKLGKMCFDVLSGKLLEIREKELSSVFNKQDEYDMLLRLGLLKTSKMHSRGKIAITFEFLHRTFVEFLAAFFFYHEFKSLQNCGQVILMELLEYYMCENFLTCLAGLLKEKFHLIISGVECAKFHEWDIGLCCRLLKECGHTKQNMEACKQWLQCIDIDTASYDPDNLDTALPLVLKSKNSVTERMRFKFSPLNEYKTGRHYVIAPRLIQAMKDCKTVLFIEVYIQFEILEEGGDEIAFVNMIASFPFLNKLLQMKKSVHISVVLHSNTEFSPFVAGKFIEESDCHKPFFLELVNESHKLLEEANIIIRFNQPDGGILKFMIFPDGVLPQKLVLGIYEPYFEDFTDSHIFKHSLEVLQATDRTMEIYLSKPDDMKSFDTKVYPLNQ